MNDDEKSDPRIELIWPVGAHSETSFYFENDKDTSILSEFGWNLRDEESDRSFVNRRFGDDVDDRYGLTEGLVSKNDGCSSVSSGPAVRIGSVEKSCGDASTSNPSVSSNSDEDMPEKSTESVGVNPPVEIASKVKKKGQKRIRQQRFAFMTKSEVDNLEDGYRWRKYGQKAVKNSTFPRSYYRCTNTNCTVKKRVERSDQDPSTVITTYEGQHCHHTVGFPRGGITHEAGFAPHLISPAVQYFPETSHDQVPREATERYALPQPASQIHRDGGLLDDIVSPRTRNR